MFWFIYNFLFTIGYLLILPKFLLRMWKRGGYRKDFLHRLGVYSPELAKRLEEKRRVWVHAVSVGEIYVALKFVDEMRSIQPSISFILSTTTSTGHRIAENRLNPCDVLIYFPADFPFVVRRVLDKINPMALILTEGEIWPNIIHHASKRSIPVMIINGRLSEASYRGYKLLRMFFSRILAGITAFLVQSDADRAKLVDLGADEKHIKVMGTAKYDVAQFDPDGEAKAREILKLTGMTVNDLIVVGGSTWHGEETVLLEIYRKLRAKFPNLKLVLVPRHAERSAEVESEIRKSGLSYVRRTDLNDITRVGQVHADVLLVNTTGELRNFYACASVIFVGKSLTQHGGQNIIEPALYAKPIVVGPNMENFVAVVDDFVKARAVIQVKDAVGLEAALDSLLSDTSVREYCGRRAGSVVSDNKGVTSKSAALVLQIITSARNV